MAVEDFSQPVLAGEGASDYERYLRTDELLKLQKRPEERAHHDELLFQTVHQSSELWLKLAAFEVEVVYVESTEATPDNGRGTFTAALPQADAPSTYVAWTVYSPEEAKVRKRTADGSLRLVEDLSNPIPSDDYYYIETETPAYEQQAVVQNDSGGLGTGSVPVPVSLPLQGDAVYFEKLLALDEPLTVEFAYKGLRK